MGSRGGSAPHQGGPELCEGAVGPETGIARVRGTRREVRRHRWGGLSLGAPIILQAKQLVKPDELMRSYSRNPPAEQVPRQSTQALLPRVLYGSGTTSALPWPVAWLIAAAHQGPKVRSSVHSLMVSANVWVNEPQLHARGLRRHWERSPKRGGSPSIILGEHTGKKTNKPLVTGPSPRGGSPTHPRTP